MTNIMTDEIQALLENQLSNEYKGIIAQVFKDRDEYKSQSDKLTLKLEDTSKRFNNELNVNSELREELRNLKETLKERTEQMAEAEHQASQYLELKLRAQMAQEVVANNFKTLGMVFGTPQVQKTIHGQVKCMDRFTDGSSYERVEPTEDITTETVSCVSSVSTSGELI